MNLKKELQDLNNKLDKTRRKLNAAQQREDNKIIFEARQELNALNKQINAIKGACTRELSAKGAKIKAMPFNRVITKAEQADMGKLKKTVRGLVIVHPLTALGRELGVTEVTGFAFKQF